MEITIYIDHMNNMNLLTKSISKYIQHWHQLIEEFSSKFIYLRDSANNLANVLSQSDTAEQIVEALYALDTENLCYTYEIP